MHGAGRPLPEGTVAVGGRVRGRWTVLGRDGSRVSHVRLRGAGALDVTWHRPFTGADLAKLACDRKVVLSGEESRLPPLLERRLETWDRLAELSADRAGYAAVEGNLNAIVSAFFKMASGLGPAHLRYDIDAFLSQLEELQRELQKDQQDDGEE